MRKPLPPQKRAMKSFIEKTSRNKSRKAEQDLQDAIKAALENDAAVKEELRVDRRDIAELNRIIRSPKAPRNSVAKINAINTKLRYTMALPKQEIDVDGKLEVVVTTLATPENSNE